ncbi:uncharacterized protein [Antedon mediterranea]|uniref:uncharacterized protein isoform X2 n=1 Tax=Antedon mediterranea TaxID=105859 RepID=UPI003AF84902
MSLTRNVIGYIALIFNIYLDYTTASCDESFPSIYDGDYDDCWNDWDKEVDRGFGLFVSLLIGAFAFTTVVVILIVVCCVCYKQNHQAPHSSTQTHIGLSVIHPAPHGHTVSTHGHQVSTHGHTVSSHLPYQHNHAAMTLHFSPPAYNSLSLGPMSPGYQCYGQPVQPSSSQFQPSYGLLVPPSNGQPATPSYGSPSPVFSCSPSPQPGSNTSNGPGPPAVST